MHYLLKKYWIMSTGRVVKLQVNNYIPCKRRDAKPMSTAMAPLPCHQLTPFKPALLYTGIDYFGQVTVKMSGRGRQEKTLDLSIHLPGHKSYPPRSDLQSKRRRLSHMLLKIHQSTPTSASNLQRHRHKLTSWRTRIKGSRRRMD